MNPGAGRPGSSVPGIELLLYLSCECSYCLDFRNLDFVKLQRHNGMLRHSLATLEGCIFLWHIVAPSSRLSLFFCLFGQNDCLPARAKQGMAIQSLKIHEQHFCCINIFFSKVGPP